MACLETLIADVEQIRNLLETKKDCCDSNTVYFPTDLPETEITPGVGDPPDYYGETAVTDWDDWAEHVCYNAHAYVDYLKTVSYNLMNAVNISSIFLGLISSALVLLAFSGIGLPIAFGLAAAVVTGIALGATATTFATTASDFESAREDIVCAIVTGNSLADAVEDALSSGTDWDLFFQFVDYESAIAILYEGGYETEYLPSETRDDCGDCEYVPDFNGFERWSAAAVVDSDETFGAPSCHEWFEAVTETFTTINECAVPFSGKIHLVGYVTIVGYMTSNANCTNQMWLEVDIRISGHNQCEMIADQGTAYEVCEKKTESTGAKDYTIPYDITTAADWEVMHTLCLQMRTNIRSGASHQIVIENHVTLIEEGV